MTRICSRPITILLMALGFSALAGAQATRTWISGVGDDANPCSRTAPCKTFAGAISKTASAGEIDCLDPGGFGAVTITKPITLDCGPGVGSILVAGTNGILINTTGPSDAVTIRNLTLEGLATGLSGISIIAGNTVHIENVKIHDFTGFGVQVNATANVNLSMHNVTIAADNATGGGVSVSTTLGIAIAELRDIRVHNSQAGVQGGSNASVNISNSDLSSNVFGALVTGASTGIDLIGCQLNYNSSAAVQSNAASSVRVMSSTLHRNGIAFNPNGGNLLSDGQNTNDGNTSNGSSTGPTPAKI